MTIVHRYQFPYHKSTAPKRLFWSPDPAPPQKDGAKLLLIHSQSFHHAAVSSANAFHAQAGNWVRPNIVLHEVVENRVRPNVVLHEVAENWVQPKILLHEVAENWVKANPMLFEVQAVVINGMKTLGEVSPLTAFAVCVFHLLITNQNFLKK